MSNNVTDRVTEYARKVVSGEVFCGELHRLACQRHLKDLEKQNTKEFPYFWSIEESEKVLEYAEDLTILEGFKKQPVKLLDFQIFDIGCRFGWKNEKNKRRFRRSYKSMARQNGKTFENGILGTYIANFSGYNYGKLFCVATKKRQARIAWEEMARFINADEDLSEIFTVKDYKSLIIAQYTNSTIEALSKESGLDDGFRSLYNSLDEIHQMQSNQIYKALYNGTRALPETLTSMISTRGDKLNSFGYEIDTYAVNILKGLATAEDFFVDIYCLDTKDNIFDSKNLIKANPYLATTEEGMKNLLTDMQTAKDMGGSELRDFMIKSLNLWVRNTEDNFVDPEAWKKCETDKTLEDMRGKECYAGLDLSSGGDLTTLHLKFPLEDGKSYEYSHSFMPRGRQEEHIVTDIAPYDLWEAKELITVTGGKTEYKNDYKFIIKHLRDLIEEYDIILKGIGYDNHNADVFLSDLEEFGVPLLEVRQTARFLNDATEDMQLNIKSGFIEYNKENELLTYSIANAKITKNSMDEKKVDKEKNSRTRRIDPVDAMIDANVAYMKLKEETKYDTEKGLEAYLEKMGWK